MHQPRPHGRFFYGEGELGAEDAAAAELLVRRLTNHKGLGGLDSLKMARTLPSGATAVAVDAGGVLRLLIYQHQKPQPDASMRPRLIAVDDAFGVEDWKDYWPASMRPRLIAVDDPATSCARSATRTGLQ